MKLIGLLMLAFGLSISSTSVFADPKLGLYIEPIDSDCPFTQAQLENRIEGEFLRARLKPEDSENVFLYVKLLCLKTHAGDRHNGYIVSSKITFAMGEGEPELLLLDDFGTLAVGGPGESSKQFLLNGVVGGVSDGITEFLKATL